jgi:hypothetical protein
VIERVPIVRVKERDGIRAERETIDSAQGSWRVTIVADIPAQCDLQQTVAGDIGRQSCPIADQHVTAVAMSLLADATDALLQPGVIRLVEGRDDRHFHEGFPAVFNSRPTDREFGTLW